MINVLKQIADNLGVTGYDDSSLLIGIADYYGVNTAISTSLMGDILDAVGGNAATSNNYIQDIVIALGGPSTSLNWIEEWEAITAVPVYFTTTWTTTAPNETITLPYDAAGTYSGSIDWGDSNTDVNSFANNTHTYAVAGTYTVQIIGDCIGWNFGAYAGSTYITSVVHWGQLQLGANTGSYFKSCPNLDLSSVFDVLDLTGITNFSSMFQSSGITTINKINLWNTSNITSMSGMFASATAFNQALSFGTSAVTNMDFMFQNATSFNQSLISFNTGQVTKMAFMFQNATSFNQSLSTFNTKNVTNMNSMFANASSFNQSLSTFNTKNVTNMAAMFDGATAFNQNIGSWNVVNVTAFKNFMNGKTPATFSTANLDAIYNGWSASGVQANCQISFSTAKYTVAAVAGRAILTGVKFWAITDGGL